MRNATSSVEDYERRLKQLPPENTQLQQQIRHYETLVQEQENDIQTQQLKLKLYEEEMSKIDKLLETRENEIQELTETEEKSSQKEKKYFMQIQNYNKKIEALKKETARLQKSIALLKKDSKQVQSNVSSANNDKNKTLSQLTKGQLRLNTMTQTLNDMKVRAMEKGGQKAEEIVDAGKREEKQLNQLFTAIKKQMQLIDILKKQKVHLIASTVFKYCQEDFTALLQMNQQQ